MRQQPTDAGPMSFDLSTITHSIHQLAVSALARVPYLVIGLLVLGAGVLVARLAEGAAQSAKMDTSLGYLLSRLASALVGVLAVLAAAVVIFPTLKPGDVFAGLGITSVAIGFALKDVLQNFFAGVMLLWCRPFHVGDQIRSGEYEGTVEEINVRSTRLKTYDGERVVLPNGDVYTRAIVVRTAYDKRRVRFVVGVGYPDDLEKARAIIRRTVASTEGVLADPGPWVYVSELAPSSVNFTVFFWAESHQANVLLVSDRVATGIKLALDAAHIDMPFPHSVVLFHDQTGSRDGDARPGQGHQGDDREAPASRPPRPGSTAASPPG